MKQKTVQVFSNFLLYAAMVVVNTLAVVLPINNKSTGELSDMYPNLFVPAGITFSIWGVIYLALLSMCIYQIVSVIRKSEGVESISDIGWFFALSSGFNISWIFAWHYLHLTLSLLIMVFLLITLLIIYLRLEIGSKSVSWKERIFVHAPISIYFGWISVATIANATAFLVGKRWSGFLVPAEVWTILVISVGILLALLMIVLRRDLLYAAVIVWAFIGIIIKRSGIDLPSSRPIIVACWTGIIIITAIAILNTLRRKFCFVET